MPTEKIVTLYTYDELSDEAKARARDWYREGGFDYEWYDSVYEDFERIAKIIGIDLKTSQVPLMGGGHRTKPVIYFSGFWSQGDGACFEGTYTYRAGFAKELRAYAPKDERLHRIAADIVAAQKPHGYGLTANIVHRGHYYHSGCMDVEVWHDDLDRDIDWRELQQAMRDLADWLYRQLEQEYEYISSDEAVAETIEANEYTFTESGRRED